MISIKLVYCIEYYHKHTAISIFVMVHAGEMTIIFGYLRKFFNNIEKKTKTDIGVLLSFQAWERVSESIIPNGFHRISFNAKSC